MAAAERGSLGCIKVLLARGGGEVDIDAATSFTKQTALHFGVKRDYRPDSTFHIDAVAELLLEAGADPLARDDRGRTPLHRARRCEKVWGMGKSDVALLQAVIAEPHRARALFKARGIIDIAAAVPKAFKSAAAKGLSILDGPAAAGGIGCGAWPLEGTGRVGDEAAAGRGGWGR